MEVSGYIAIVVVLLHAPLLYFNGKDMLLIIIGEWRNKTCSSYLRNTGLSSRVKTDVRVKCESGSVDLRVSSLA